MKSPRIYLVFAISIAVISLLLSSCGGKEYVVRAKQYMDAKRYDDAVKELNIALVNDPENADATYLLGKCYLKQSDFLKADRSFAKAVSLKPTYSKKIANLYIAEGKNYLENNNIDSAEKTFQSAVNYNENLARQVAGFFFDKSKKMVSEKKKADGVKELFQMVVVYDPKMEKAYVEGDVITDKEVIEDLEKAKIASGTPSKPTEFMTATNPPEEKPKSKKKKKVRRKPFSRYTDEN